MATYKLNFVTLCILAAFLFSTTACHTVQKYVESGNYDGGIDLAVRKLRGKKKKKVEYVKGLELAFEKVQERDLQRIDNLMAAGTATNWEKVNDAHKRIQARQAKVAPLLPCTASNGYRPYFTMVNIDKMEQESRKRAAEYLYARAERLMIKARTGDKAAAREAYQTLYELECKYYTTYCEKDKLMEEASALGTTYVLFTVRNKSGAILPAGFTDQILSMSKRELDSKWLDFSFRKEGNLSYDYQAFYDIRQIDISPERIKERTYTDEKKVEDGLEYVLDGRGNVMKDSLGNDIKVAKLTLVRANVLEVFQSKAARMDGDLLIYETGNSSPLDRRAIGAEVVFEHYASTFQGDKRALSAESRKCIGNQPLPFPDNRSMLLDVADRLKPDIRAALIDSRRIF